MSPTYVDLKNKIEPGGGISEVNSENKFYLPLLKKKSISAGLIELLKEIKDKDYSIPILEAKPQLKP